MPVAPTPPPPPAPKFPAFVAFHPAFHWRLVPVPPVPATPAPPPPLPPIFQFEGKTSRPEPHHPPIAVRDENIEFHPLTPSLTVFAEWAVHPTQTVTVYDCWVTGSAELYMNPPPPPPPPPLLHPPPPAATANAFNVAILFCK